VLVLALLCIAAALPGAALASRRGGCAHRSSYREGSSGRHHRSCGAHHGHARSTGCHNVNLRPNASNLKLIRGAVLCLVNRERTRRGERALRPNARLRAAAQGHSESMAQGDYFNHVSPSGVTPLARMRAVGYISRRTRGYEVGENIAYGTLWLGTPRSIVAAWMASPGHRANILDGRFHDTAIGVSTRLANGLTHGQPGAMYTEDFGVRLGR